MLYVLLFFFFQAEDGIRDLVRSRGLGDVYKRQKRRGADDVVAGADQRQAHMAEAFLRAQAGDDLRLSLIHI